MKQHLLDEDLAGILHAQGDHGQAVADQDDVHTSMIGDMSAGEIMGCNHCDGFAFPIQASQGTEGDFFPLVGRCGAHGGMGAVPAPLTGGERRRATC